MLVRCLPKHHQSLCNGSQCTPNSAGALSWNSQIHCPNTRPPKTPDLKPVDLVINMQQFRWNSLTGKIKSLLLLKINVQTISWTRICCPKGRFWAFTSFLFYSLTIIFIIHVMWQHYSCWAPRQCCMPRGLRAMLGLCSNPSLRAGCTNAQLTVWLSWCNVPLAMDLNKVLTWLGVTQVWQETPLNSILPSQHFGGTSWSVNINQNC